MRQEVCDLRRSTYYGYYRLLAAQREIVVLTGEKTDLEETLSSVQARVYVNVAHVHICACNLIICTYL